MELIGFYFIWYDFGISRQICHDTLSEDSWENGSHEWRRCDDPRFIAPGFFLLR